MKKLLIAGTAVLALATGAHTVQATEEVTRLPNVGPWMLAVDHTMDDGCFILTTWKTPSAALRVQLDSKIMQGPFVLLFNEGILADAKPDSKYTLNVSFTGRPDQQVQALAAKGPGGLMTLMFPVSGVFSAALQEALSVRITFAKNGAPVLLGQLTSSDAAMQALVQCQVRQDATAASAPTTVPEADPEAPAPDASAADAPAPHASTQYDLNPKRKT